MGFLYKKILFRFLIFGGLFTSANLFGGYFNNSSCHKPVRISLASKKFIQEVLPLQQGLGLTFFADWTYSMQNKEFFLKSDIEKLQSILRVEKQELFNTTSSVKINTNFNTYIQGLDPRVKPEDDEEVVFFSSIHSHDISIPVNISTSPVVLGLDPGIQQSNGLKDLLKILSKKLSGLNARGFEHDLLELKNFIDSIQKNGRFIGNQEERKIKALGYVTIIGNIVSSFEGVFVTDYDVFVLASTAQALFLDACDVKN
jgi:hypothetical protein